MFPDSVSVVTTTWNEQQNLEKLIAAIHSALSDYVHEIIVVDDSSTDGTIDVAKKFADIAVTKLREGQTKGLLYGMQLVEELYNRNNRCGLGERSKVHSSVAGKNKKF